MYGKGAGVSTVGVAVLPSTGDNRILFAVAVSLLVAGVVVLAASMLMARKKSHSEAN